NSYLHSFPTRRSSDLDDRIVNRTTDKVSIVEPESFIATITTDSYTACESTSTTLSLASIVAVKGEQKIELDKGTTDHFSYQWIYNNKELSGATGKTLS